MSQFCFFHVSQHLYVGTTERLWSSCTSVLGEKALETQVLAWFSVGFSMLYCNVGFSRCIQRTHLQHADFQIPLTFSFSYFNYATLRLLHNRSQEIWGYILGSPRLAIIHFKVASILRFCFSYLAINKRHHMNSKHKLLKSVLMSLFFSLRLYIHGWL